MTTSVPVPFTLDTPQPVLDDLRARLAATRWPDEVTGAGWDYGASLAYMRSLAEHWLNHFDWRAQETALNVFPHYRMDVDGLGLHFIHARGRGPNPTPLILTHGWPSSFFELTRVIPLLTDPGAHGGDPAQSFDVVVPSLPGYGFSDRPRAGGMITSRVAELWVALMAQLGYPRFAAIGLTTEAVDRAPREWAGRSYDIRRWTEFPRGGHFFAFEEPGLLAEELRQFFR